MKILAHARATSVLARLRRRGRAAGAKEGQGDREADGRMRDEKGNRI